MSRPYAGHLFYQDEMRTGTRTELKRRWTPVNHRPITAVKIGYDFVYLYAAINPYDGKLIALLLPYMTKECFAIFMDYFSEQVRKEYGQEQKILMIADGATNHQQSAIFDPNIHFEKLPTACPELNPVERFFEQLRTEISNFVFETIEKVQNHLCQILKKYFDNPKSISSLTLFPYIRTD